MLAIEYGTGRERSGHVRPPHESDRGRGQDAAGESAAHQRGQQRDRGARRARHRSVRDARPLRLREHRRGEGRGDRRAGLRRARRARHRPDRDAERDPDRDLHPHDRQEGQIAATLLRGAALADGRSPSLRTGISLLIRGDRVAYLGPDGGAPHGTDIDAVDASGATIVPGLVDCHAHFAGVGGADWIARFQDDEAALLSRAPDAARALVRAGVLAARDVGAPHHLNLRIRDEMRGQSDAPLIVAAGTWIARRDTYVPFAIQVDSAEQLKAAALAELDATVSVPAGVRTFASTVGGKWSEQEPARREMQERAFAAVRAAKKAGVRIVAGSDFGGGSVRPGHLAWEVELLVAAGLEPYEALAAATWRGGELLGNGVGTITQGGAANVVVVHGDLLADPAALWRVWR